MPLKIVPALLADNIRVLKEQLDRVEPYFQRVQLDVVDGLFAPNTSAGPEGISWPEKMKIDLHLMVNQPEEYLHRYADFKLHRVIAQIEPLRDQAVFVRRAREMRFKPGLALDLKTPVENLDLATLGEVDYVLVMGVKAGFSGQSFQPIALKKISLLDRWRKADRGFNFIIGVDGGVDPNSIGAIRQVGADEVAVTSYLFKSPSIPKALEELRA